MTRSNRAYGKKMGCWVTVAFCIWPSLLPAQQNAQTAEKIQPREYQERRVRTLTLLDSSAAIVMKSFDPRVRSNDVNYRYRQESNFYYLTGLDELNCYLLLAPNGVIVDGTKTTSVLFVPPGHEMLSQHTELSQEIILPNDRFHQILTTALTGIKTLYYSAPDFRFVYDWLNEKALFIERDARKEFEETHPDLKLRGAGTVLAPERGIKSDAEIALIQKSIDITASGIQQAMRLCKPGRWEYELQAVIEYEMTRRGAEYQSFPSIIGSGENSLILHYDDNRRQMKSGELVVMDVGAEYGGYAADITRTIPVSGTFTPAQKEVYSVVLRAQQAVIEMIKPGILLRNLDARAREVITTAGYGDFIRHGVSHGVGIDVHDVLGSDTLKAGMVITVEPGIYIPPDAKEMKSQYRGFGIRIEDDVVVTKTGHEVLSKNIPKQPDEIEGIMKR